MISCDEYQKKMVAVLDNEGSEEDERLLSAHLADCPECRAFYDGMVSTRQLFSIATATKAAVTIGKDFLRTVEADALRSKKLSGKKHIRSSALFWDKLPRLAWAGGLAAALLVIVSWLACYSLTKEVADLKGQLQDAQQHLAVARAEKQLEEDRQREQKAITALYLRMAELEERVERFSSPRTPLFPTELNGLSGRRSDL
jgi:predicted anti-sigma-YlaC factor YlaD